MNQPKMATPRQIRTLHALACKSGMDHEDLHNLACGMTGAKSLKELTLSQYISVEQELQKRQSRRQRKTEPQNHPSVPGKMTAGQKRLAWRLMYELRSYDREPNEAGLGDRLVGIIRRQIKVDASPGAPMQWLTFEQGVRLIEILKKYVYNAATRRGRE